MMVVEERSNYFPQPTENERCKLSWLMSLDILISESMFEGLGAMVPGHLSYL